MVGSYVKAVVVALMVAGVSATAVGCGDDAPPAGSDAGAMRADSGLVGGDAGPGRPDSGAGVDAAAASDGGGVIDGGARPDAGGLISDGGARDGGAGGSDGGTAGAVCGGFGGSACAAGEFCDYAIADICGAADATGICRPRPEVCTDIYMPVCGCDGMTYSNACSAHRAGVAVASEGVCP